MPLLERGLIRDVGNTKVRITDAGWKKIESATKASGSQGFIAMAFRDMDHVDLAIQTAITSAGYKPCRIDREEYLGGVMDEILARIRQSRFVVADLPHNRGGVYYEAGFALGLGIPVIPTCRIDHVDGSAHNLRVHFDVQHINLLTWEESKLDVLTAKLSARIVAFFGVGPLPRPG
jgi:nucleoside 2-deoxyribosyltransferase